MNGAAVRVGHDYRDADGNLWTVTGLRDHRGVMLYARDGRALTVSQIRTETYRLETAE